MTVGASPIDLSNRVGSLRSSKIREVAEEGIGHDDIIALWFGEGCWKTSDRAVEIASAALRDGAHFYQSNNGMPVLRQAICDYFDQIYGLKIDQPRVTVTTSGMQGLALAAQVLIDPGDRVVSIEPAWPNLSQVFRISGGEVEIQRLKPGEGRWVLDLDELLARLTPGTRAVVINSPNNPTGWALDPDEARIILEHCRKHGIWITADDVYSRLYRGADFAPGILQLAEPEDRVISVNSFSKAWSMTGWRLGWLAGPAELAPIFAQLTEYNMSCTAGFVQEAGKAMIEVGEDEVRHLQDKLATGYQLIKSRLQNIEDVDFIDPDGAFYSFFSLAGMTNSVGFCKALLKTTGVGLAPGLAFGREAEGYVRLC
ncbi:MAG: pyridoxal phosphate-dependent aminotransferase, partial [Desulfobulbia bacterium]